MVVFLKNKELGAHQCCKKYAKSTYYFAYPHIILQSCAFKYVYDGILRLAIKLSSTTHLKIVRVENMSPYTTLFNSAMGFLIKDLSTQRPIFSINM